MSSKSSGKLYIVSTPIGHLEDITIRALNVLKEIDCVVAEDTRKTRHLLTHYQINKPLLSFFEHNEAHRLPQVIQKLRQGESVALVTDAGTPGISDPGYRLVVAALQHDIVLIPIPGPSSLLAALVVSGLPMDRFQFLGFLPAKPGKRRKLLESLKDYPGTLIFFESPHRLLKAAHDLADIFHDRLVVMGREITKIHEEFLRMTLPQLVEHLARTKIRGEMTLLVAGCKKDV